MAFNIIHPQLKVTLIALREPSPTEAADILEHIDEFKDVLKRRFVENGTGRCSNCGAWETSWTDCQAEDQGKRCRGKPKPKFYVDFSGYYNTVVEFIEIWTWTIFFKNEYSEYLLM